MLGDSRLGAIKIVQFKFYIVYNYKSFLSVESYVSKLKFIQHEQEFDAS